MKSQEAGTGIGVEPEGDEQRASRTRPKRSTWVAGGIVAVVAIAAVAGGGLAFASHRIGARVKSAAMRAGGFEPLVLKRIARELDLTDDQKGEIREVLSTRWSAGLGEAADAARAAHRELRHAIQDAAASDDQVRAAVRTAAAADEKLALERHRAARDVIALLDDAQKEKAKKLRDDFEETGDEIFGMVDRFLGRG